MSYGFRGAISARATPPPSTSRRTVRSDVAHVWAHRLQEHARNSTGSLYFDGDTIYSYGRHFPIARHVTDRHGRACVLFTTRDYSVTTSSHKSAVRAAIPRDVRVFHVRNVDEAPGKDALDEYASRIDEKLLAAARARKWADSALRRAEQIVTEANEFCEAFKLRRRFKMPDDTSVAAIRERAAAQAKRDAAERRRKERELAAKRTEQLRAWAGDASLTWEPGYNYMRLSAGRFHIETDMHALVSVADVQAIAPAVVAMFAAGETYKRNGHTLRVGQYPLEEVTADAVRVGCHVFSRAEVERIAALVASLPPMLPSAHAEAQL